MLLSNVDINMGYTLQTSRSIASDLAFITQNFVNYLPLVFLVLGVVGFIGNLFTYLQAELRSNTYSVYSICGSFVDVATLCINAFPNYLVFKYGISMWPIGRFPCKLNLFLLVFLPHLSLNILLASTIDRLASTCSLNSPLKRINRMKAVSWMLYLTVIFSCLTSIQAPILYDLMYGFLCISTKPTTSAALYIIFNGLMPPLLMFVVIFFTYRNVRQSRKRVVSAERRYESVSDDGLLVGLRAE